MNNSKNTIGEFNEVFKKSQTGNLESTKKLLEMLNPLIKNSIKKYYYKNMDKEDLIQEGNLKILECINSFDSSKGVYFLGYIKSQLKYLYLNLNKYQNPEISLNTKVNLGEDKVELMDLIEDEKINIEKIFMKSIDIESLNKTIKFLSPREYQIIKLYYFEDLSMKNISYKLNLAYRTVVNTKVNAIGKLKKMIP